MEWYPWLNAPYRQLVDDDLKGRAHHAVLLHALPGMGHDALVYALARRRLCQHPEGMKSCGVCHSCQLMMAGTHPDWYALAPEKGKHSLGVDAIRDMLESVYHRSRQGGAKLVWIASVEQLTEAAANALLKTLEEPPAATYFLLGCQDPATLLATLRSRCYYLYVPVPDEAQSMAWLNQRQPQEALSLQTALRLQAGAPLAAEALLQPACWQQRTTLCQSLTVAVAQGGFFSLLSALNDDDAAQRLHWLSSLLLDALKCQRGAPQAVVNVDQCTLIQMLADTLPSQTLQRLLQRVLVCRHRLLTVVSVNRELLLSDLLLGWDQGLSPTADTVTLPFSAV